MAVLWIVLSISAFQYGFKKRRHSVMIAVTISELGFSLSK